MEAIANAEKQARYRKKDSLKRKADVLFSKWQSDSYFAKHKKSLHEVQHLIEKATELPHGWNEQDYMDAEAKLEHVHAELFWSVNQLENDLNESSNFDHKFMTVQDVPKLNADLERSKANTSALASHIISAIRLSSCDEAEQAAALMEAVRVVGRTLAMGREIPRSEATAVCLSTVNSHYIRPDWFVKKLAGTLSKQLGNEVSKEVGKLLVK